MEFQTYYERHKQGRLKKAREYYEQNKDQVLHKAKQKREAKKSYQQFMKELAGIHIQKQAKYLTDLSTQKQIDPSLLTTIWELYMQKTAVEKRLDPKTIINFERFLAKRID
ncbi:TPA: hypothetical protein NG675_004974 [Vibrio parahaemolyticus]|nr:hypothetical protein [Vibrio parahaemolyticus]HCE2814415.1 hypothetical protein [Vibrio parahaemolyticus]HCE2818710.1 hypothetical protein [Vibrio parahaemolyticus]HCG5303165.1 hypothetical protein [Vibrio parahaemolyticus]HCG5307358.1 hypothetical protein [Vibrio parahaemolyticus]